MERDALRALLERLDDAEHAEALDTWNRSAAEAHFVGLATALEQHLGYPCPSETGVLVQDASFHGQIFLPREILSKDERVSLRASNFDRLATVYDDETVVQPAALTAIVTTLVEPRLHLRPKCHADHRLHRRQSRRRRIHHVDASLLPLDLTMPAGAAPCRNG